MWNEKAKIRIWIWIEIGSKGSRSFGPIFRAVQIQIKILKKDLDPRFSDPLVRSSNSLVSNNWGLIPFWANSTHPDGLVGGSIHHRTNLYKWNDNVGQKNQPIWPIKTKNMAILEIEATEKNFA